MHVFTAPPQIIQRRIHWEGGLGRSFQNQYQCQGRCPKETGAHQGPHMYRGAPGMVPQFCKALATPTSREPGAHDP